MVADISYHNIFELSFQPEIKNGRVTAPWQQDKFISAMKDVFDTEMKKMAPVAPGVYQPITAQPIAPDNIPPAVIA
jgi:hypothetical protein